MNNRNMRPNAGDFVLSEESKQWLDQHKERLARLRSDQRLVTAYFKALDDLHKHAFEVNIYYNYNITNTYYVAT